jgi:hypothetical protein
VLRRQDSSAPAHRLQAGLVVQQVELVQAKPTRTRVNRDR